MATAAQLNLEPPPSARGSCSDESPLRNELGESEAELNGLLRARFAVGVSLHAGRTGRIRSRTR